MASRSYDRIVMDAGNADTHLLVPQPAQLYRYLEPSCRARLTEMLTRPDGTLRSEVPFTRSYRSMMQSPCDDFERQFVGALRRHGWDEPFLFAYTMRASPVVGSADSAAVQARIDAIVGGR